MGARTVSATLVAILLATTLLPAARAAGATPLGINDGGVAESAAAGAKPAFATFWVGKWTNPNGWGALDAMLDESRRDGVTPLVLWYYWANAGSPACVENGCEGKSRAEWTAMTSTLASHLKARMGGARAIVVLENEFNKNGIVGAYAPTFDGYLAGVSTTLKAVPGVQTVVGFGGWGESDWASFPRAIAASDFVGFQLMRASTRDSAAAYRDAPNVIASQLAVVKAIGKGKGAFLYDLALASYGGSAWEAIQKETLASILARRGEYAANGLAGISYRGTRDSPTMDTSDWYGMAEVTWGLKDARGNPKPAWGAWVAAFAAYAPAFSSPSGNEWWISIRVDEASSVCASVNGGACAPLPRQSWGAYAASLHAPAGSTVRFTATSAAGQKATSGAYAWPPTPAPPPPPAAAFAPSGNAWWVQTTVSPAATSVCASVDGGACVALPKQWWGAFAASIHVASGSSVRFTATLADGAKATSGSYAWGASGTS